MSGPKVVSERRGGYALLTLSNPERLNAISSAMWEELERGLDEAMADGALRAVVITGEGDRAFCAGGDLSQGPRTAESVEQSAAEQFRRLGKIERCPKPVISAVNGLALGGGAFIVLASDIIVAAEGASIGFPEPRIGIAPIYAVMRLAQVLPATWARYLISTGERITAQEAYRLGWVNRVVPRARLLDEAQAVVDSIARCAPLAVAFGKRFSGIDRARDAEIERAAVELYKSRDYLEGVQAFREKRPPEFQGR